MEETLPINPERRINLLKRILFFPNVTAFKIAKSIPSLSDYRRNYHARMASFGVVSFAEILIIIYLFPKFDGFSFNRTWVDIVCFNLIIEVGFRRDVYKMGFDYYTYYNKYLLYISFILAIAGFCWVFNDMIGK